MITERKVNIYEKYNGLVDAYIFENGDLPNKDFDLMDWSLIDELIGNLILLKTGKAADSFKQVLICHIQKYTKNDNVVELLKKIADRKIRG